MTASVNQAGAVLLWRVRANCTYCLPVAASDSMSFQLISSGLYCLRHAIVACSIFVASLSFQDRARRYLTRHEVDTKCCSAAESCTAGRQIHQPRHQSAKRLASMACSLPGNFNQVVSEKPSCRPPPIVEASPHAQAAMLRGPRAVPLTGTCLTACAVCTKSVASLLISNVDQPDDSVIHDIDEVCFAPAKRSWR